MILLVALAAAGLWLVLGAPPRPVARLHRVTTQRGIQRDHHLGSGAKHRGRASKKSSPAPEVDVAIILDLLAVALKMGSPIPDALSGVGEAITGRRGAALGKVAAHLMLGSPWELAWHEVPTELGLDPVAGALAPAWLNGAPVAALLLHAQRRIRQQQAAQDRIAAKQLGVRLILPVTVCYLPAFVAVGLLPVVLVLVQQGISFL